MTSGAGSLLQVTLSLIVVLGAVFGFAWLMRRMRMFGRPAGGALDVIAEVPLGLKERAVLVKVGNTQLLIGVAPGRVNTLHVLSEPVDLQPPANKSDTPAGGPPSFRSLLMRSLGK